MILITGATGFLGKELLKRNKFVDVRVVSRNEGKLIELKQQFPNIEIMTGDIADPYVCQRALQDIDQIFHLAAFKHVGLAEDQPYECIQSNVIGTMNLLYQFTGNLFVAISTDKAAQVNGVYGATKLLMERLIKEKERISFPYTHYRVVRYGNVLYSTGSVLCKWKEAFQRGQPIKVTDFNATRFFWTVDQAVDLIFESITHAKDSTPYCPTMKAMRVGDLMLACWKKYNNGTQLIAQEIGLQPGENLHEKVLEQGPYSNEVERYSIEQIMELI